MHLMVVSRPSSIKFRPKLLNVIEVGRTKGNAISPLRNFVVKGGQKIDSVLIRGRPLII